jgi:GNAT superfamily N-acetyltransferase
MDDLPSSPRTFRETPSPDEKSVHALRHVLFKARAPIPGLEREYELAYDFWLSMWRSTFREVGAAVELHSDVFLLHDEVSAILQGDRVVGLMLYDYRDLRVTAHRDLSNFSHYPPGTLEHLQSQGVHRVMLAGQLTVHPEWRRSRVGPFMSETLTSLAIKRFLSSHATAAIAFTRNDRNTQELAYRLGAMPLRKGHRAYGIASDVVAFYRDRVRESPTPQVACAVNRLWERTPAPQYFARLPAAFTHRAENTQVIDKVEHG